MTTKSFNKVLNEGLIDPEFAAEYLNGCYQDGPEVFVVALKNIIEARGDISSFAISCGISRYDLDTAEDTLAERLKTEVVKFAA